MKKCAKDTIKARYVLGELRLKDYWSLAEGKFDLLELVVDFNPDYYSNFRFDDKKGLVVYGDEHCDAEIFVLPPETIVKPCVDGDGIECIDEGGEEHTIRFFKAEPVKIQILGEP